MGSLYNKGTPLVPKIHQDEKEHRRLLAEGLEQALLGNLKNTSASLKLGHNVASTTVSDIRAGADSVVLLMPTSVNGSVALNTFHIGTQGEGFFVIQHVSTSTSDATVKYAIFG